MTTETKPQMSDPEYARGYVVKIMALDAITTIIGLIIWLMPFYMGWYPGAFDTTLHITFGALVTTLAAFRVLLGYGSSWVEVCLVVLGVLVFFLPKFNHMEWNSTYNGGHLAMGAIIIVVSIISAILTTIEMKKTAR